MPKPPLINDPSKRETAIAIVMAVVLVGSLLLTWLLTGASLV